MASTWPIKAVLFDLDGTLLDSRRLITEAYRHACRQVLGRELADEELVARWGEPLQTRIAHTAPDATPDQLDAVVTAYTAYYLAHHDRLAHLFPGVLEMLDALARRGRRMAVVTSKRRATTRRGLDVFGLHRFITTAVSADDVEHPKPAAEPVLAALRELGADPDEAVMVGDGIFDILAARAAAVRSVAALWGTREPEALRAAGPDYEAGAPGDVVAIVDSG